MLGPVVLGQHVRLGPLTPEHLDNYCRWFADPEVTRFLQRDNPPSAREELAWFDAAVASPTDVIWGLFAEEQYIGSTGLAAIDWRHRRATTGIMIGEKAWWGRGIATEAMHLRTRYAFEELGLEKLITTVDIANVASRRALERAGYQTVGIYRHHHFRHGSWGDVWIGEVLRSDWSDRRSASTTP